MKTQQAISLAGTGRALAELLGITPSAVSQWGEEVPDPRIWQLKVLRPAWFEPATLELVERRQEQLPIEFPDRRHTAQGAS